MIPVVRSNEPLKLSAVRAREMGHLRGLGRQPSSKEIKGYDVVASELWSDQFYKCCYCELKIGCGYNDVEHYRPKARADRTPGCDKTHGYWWLAFTWHNLLFACPPCNRSDKNDRFPLSQGAISLEPEAIPPGGEMPLLLDPGGAENPVLHIEFVYDSPLGIVGPPHWLARARHGSERGRVTIEVCGLNRQELYELRDDHIERVVEPSARELEDALVRGTGMDVLVAYRRALRHVCAGSPFAAVSYDALRHFVPSDRLDAAAGLRWPNPADIPTR